MTGDVEPFPFSQTPAAESGSAFSPDGRFVAYSSDESGQAEVFVQAFPASGAKWQISVDLRMPVGAVTTTFRASPDGQRFLTIAAAGEDKSSPILIRTGRQR